MYTAAPMSHVPSADHVADHARSVPAARPSGVDSDRLLQGQREVLIRHGNETYRLRHTRNDKLILTK